MHLLVHSVEIAKQILHMMSYLVGNDISVSKVAIGTELSFHVHKKREVDIHCLVG